MMNHGFLRAAFPPPARSRSADRSRSLNNVITGSNGDGTSIVSSGASPYQKTVVGGGTSSSSIIAVVTCRRKQNTAGGVQTTKKKTKVTVIFFLAAFISVSHTVFFLRERSLILASNRTAEEEPCSFELLYQAFGPSSSFSNDRNIHAKSNNKSFTLSTQKEEQQCWRVEDDLPRIPSNKIQLIRMIGRGFKGHIHEALIHLDSPDGEKESPSSSSCRVAVKTDQCRSFFPFPFRRQSCLARFSYLPPNKPSLLGGEYLGALVFAAARRIGKDNSTGFLPTWGIIVDDVPNDTNDSWWSWNWKGRRHRNRREKEEGRRLGRRRSFQPPSSCSTIRGVVMPIIKNLEPFYTIEPDDDRMMIAPNEFASIMLPAAEGLDLISSLGFTHNDMQPKNIGLVACCPSSDTSNRSGNDIRTTVGNEEEKPKYAAMLFDYSYLAIQEGAPCRLLSSSSSSETCQFCRDPSLPSRATGESGSSYGNSNEDEQKTSYEIWRDMHNLRRAMKRFLPPDDDLAIALDRCQTIQDMVSTLKQFKERSGGGVNN